MDVPVWVTAISFLVALPAYILWGVGAYMLGNALYSWVFIVDAPPPNPPKTK